MSEFTGGYEPGRSNILPAPPDTIVAIGDVAWELLNSARASETVPAGWQVSFDPESDTAELHSPKLQIKYGLEMIPDGAEIRRIAEHEPPGSDRRRLTDDAIRITDESATIRRRDLWGGNTGRPHRYVHRPVISLPERYAAGLLMELQGIYKGTGHEKRGDEMSAFRERIRRSGTDG